MGENEQKTIELPAMITVRELALAIQVSPIEIIKVLMNNGVMANINQPLTLIQLPLSHRNEVTTQYR